MQHGLRTWLEGIIRGLKLKGNHLEIGTEGKGGTGGGPYHLVCKQNLENAFGELEREFVLRKELGSLSAMSSRSFMGHRCGSTFLITSVLSKKPTSEA